MRYITKRSLESWIYTLLPNDDGQKERGCDSICWRLVSPHRDYSCPSQRALQFAGNHLSMGAFTELWKQGRHAGLDDSGMHRTPLFVEVMGNESRLLAWQTSFPEPRYQIEYAFHATL
jgi:hypothetical protein